MLIEFSASSEKVKYHYFNFMEMLNESMFEENVHYILYHEYPKGYIPKAMFIMDEGIFNSQLGELLKDILEMHKYEHQE